MSERWAGRRVAIVAGCRTPFCKAGTVFRDMTAIDLGVVAVREVVNRAELNPNEIDELVYGTVVHSVTAPNIAREVLLRSGLPPSVPAFTVSRACASSSSASAASSRFTSTSSTDISAVRKRSSRVTRTACAEAAISSASRSKHASTTA